MTISARTTVLSAAGAMTVLALAACGGNATSPSAASSSGTSTSPPSSSAPSSSATDPRAAFTAYRDCLAKNGVNLPDRGPQDAPPSGMPTDRPTTMPSFGPGGPAGFPLPDGVDQATFDKAQAACANLRPQFGGPDGPGGQPDATAMAAFRSCLADHDVTLGDTPDAMRQLDRTDPTVATALKTCGPLLPAHGAPPSAVPSAS